ncbi:MAG: MBL fold metallo-hydrolase [Cellulosilyticaceae bacterium]
MRHWVTKGKQEVFGIGTLRSNAYVVKNGDQYLLIDTGVKASFCKLKLVMDRLGINEHNLKALILTHTHYDHVGNAHLFKELYNTQIIVHERESTFLEEGNNPEIRGSLYVTKLLERGINKGMKHLRKYTGVEKDIIVKDYYPLAHLGFDGVIIHTPGHTIGSISVVLENEIAIVGDTMFGILRGSVYPPYAMDVGVLLNSWKRLLDMGCQVFLPGHGMMNTTKCVENTYKKLTRKLAHTRQESTADSE